MSCIAGIINLDGAPVDPALLANMTSTLQARAPDGMNTVQLGHVALGHSLLDISGGSQRDQQPCSLGNSPGNQLWLSADARIDGRAELLDKLRSHGEHVPGNATDATLILHAYHAFGDSFLSCLIGDFAFALWDESRRKLICARDQLGIRPFFYFCDNNVFLFASNIDALLIHPAVAQQLDEDYLADFLLLGVSTEPQRSVYRQIKRLPAASCLHLENRRLSIRRYWSLPPEPGFWPGTQADAQVRFGELLQLAVSDRVTTDAVAIELSGGLDSGAIAAQLSILRERQPLTIRAYTNHSPHLLPGDEEGRYAVLTGSHLGIPLLLGECQGALFECSDNAALRTAEPCSSPDLAYYHLQRSHMLSHGARVLLSGQAGDSLFTGSPHYYQRLLKKGRLWQTVFEFAQCLYYRGSLRGLGLKSALFGKHPHEPGVIPPWILPDFAARVRAGERWLEGWRQWNSAVDTSRQFQAPWMSEMLVSYEILKMPMVARHPLCDLRLVEFMLSIPRPLTLDKRIVRESMRGRLPEAVRTRPKTPLAGDGIHARLTRPAYRAGLEQRLTHLNQNYIDSRIYLENFDRYCRTPRLESPWSSWQMLTPLALDRWIACIPSNGHRGHQNDNYALCETTKATTPG